MGALIWAKFNQIRAFPPQKIKNSQKFFTPFPTSTYELYPPQAESNFRHKSAGSSNYRGASHFRPR
jgi:hypothetical protein